PRARARGADEVAVPRPARVGQSASVGRKRVELASLPLDPEHVVRGRRARPGREEETQLVLPTRLRSDGLADAARAVRIQLHMLIPDRRTPNHTALKLDPLARPVGTLPTRERPEVAN